MCGYDPGNQRRDAHNRLLGPSPGRPTRPLSCLDPGSLAGAAAPDRDIAVGRQEAQAANVTAWRLVMRAWANGWRAELPTRPGVRRAGPDPSALLPFGRGTTAVLGPTITTTRQDRAIELPLEQVHDSVARSRSATG